MGTSSLKLLVLCNIPGIIPELSSAKLAAHVTPGFFFERVGLLKKQVLKNRIGPSDKLMTQCLGPSAAPCQLSHILSRIWNTKI